MSKMKLKKTMNLNEVAPPTKKHERMVKHIKKAYKKDGKLTDDEKQSRHQERKNIRLQPGHQQFKKRYGHATQNSQWRHVNYVSGLGLKVCAQGLKDE